MTVQLMHFSHVQHLVLFFLLRSCPSVPDMVEQAQSSIRKPNKGYPTFHMSIKKLCLEISEVLKLPNMTPIFVVHCLFNFFSK